MSNQASGVPADIAHLARAARGPGARFLRTPVTAATWGELLYVLAGLPLGLLGFVLTVVQVAIGAALAITFLGLPLLALGLVTARQLAAAHRGLAARLLGLAKRPPNTPRPAVVPKFSIVPAVIVDPTAWRALAYIVLKAPLALVSAVWSLGFWTFGLLMTTSIGWWWLIPGQAFEIHDWPGALAKAVLGALLLLLAPWVTRGAVFVDRLLIRGVLEPGALAERVRELEQTRAVAVDDAAARLRGIERDLHDGTQARMVTVALHLGMIKDELDAAAGAGDLDQARALADLAHRNAKQALAEVRRLARGIHPAALDTGLDNALATLTARSAVPVELIVDLPRRPASAIETIAYFATAELLTNITKHSRATRASVSVHQCGHLLCIDVTDNGRGGADPRRGTGLAGIAERIRTVDGHLHVHSPPDGPTTVTLDLPSMPPGASREPPPPCAS